MARYRKRSSLWNLFFSGGDERFGRRKISSKKMAQRISQIEDGTDGVV